MAKREFIEKTDLLQNLDNFDWQELYLPIHFKDNVIDETITFTEQEIVKPYLKKVSEEAENLKQYPNCTFDRLNALNDVIYFINTLLSE